MSEHFNTNGVQKNININTVMGKMSLYDGIEEKAISLQEREEDGYQLQQELIHKQFKPINGYECKLQQQSKATDGKIRDLNEQDEKELLELRKRLDSLRKRRRRIQQSTRIECINQRDLLLNRLNERRRVRNQMVDEYLSAWKGRDSVALFLDCSKRWNVLNDCFSIWIDAKSAFVTINGCRLGAEATPLPTDLLIAARGEPETEDKGRWVTSATNNGTTNGNTRNPNSPPPRRSILGFFGSSENTNNGNNPSEKETKIPKALEPIRVPWMEINAALGHACLLLKILQEFHSKKDGNGMKFSHDLHPMGATSKIGIRFGSPGSAAGVLVAATGLGGLLSNSNNNENGGATLLTSPPVVYNLFFEEASSFRFFNKNARNFNWALQAFLQCVAEAAAQQTDKTIAIPYVIKHQKKKFCC